MEGFLLFSSFNGGKFDGQTDRWRKKLSSHRFGPPITLAPFPTEISSPTKFPPPIFSSQQNIPHQLRRTTNTFHQFGFHQNFCYQIKERCTGIL